MGTYVNVTDIATETGRASFDQVDADRVESWIDRVEARIASRIPDVETRAADGHYLTVLRGVIIDVVSRRAQYGDGKTMETIDDYKLAALRRRLRRHVPVAVVHRVGRADRRCWNLGQLGRVQHPSRRQPDMLSALSAGRASAEARMTDVCLISLESATGWTPDDGEPSTGGLVYKGRCRIKHTSSADSGREVGESVQVLATVEIHVPTSAGVIPPGSRVQILAGSDATVLGREFAVINDARGSQQTAIRLQCREVHR